MTYTLEDHRHRLAAWAASTAARASKVCRFTVAHGAEILEEAGFNQSFQSPKSLPDPEQLDATHAIWRASVIDAAERRKYPFKHGIAAKLINVYLKVRLVCGSHGADEKVQALHPPIDRVLLTGLEEKNVGEMKREWAEAKRIGWSKYDSRQYQEVVGLIRRAIPGQPLWTIERYWKGHQ